MAPKVRRSGRKINARDVIAPEQVEIEKKNEDGDHKINIVEARPSALSEVAKSTQIEADYKRLMACWGDVNSVELFWRTFLILQSLFATR